MATTLRDWRERWGWVPFLLLCFAIAAVGALSTISGLRDWYPSLVKPSFNPPNAVFGPVWTVLYTLIAIAGYLIWRQPASALRSRTLLLYWIQLALNFIWTPLFFYFHLTGFALAELIVMDVVVMATVLRAFRLNRVAGWLLSPYLAWILFATALNEAIVVLNR